MCDLDTSPQFLRCNCSPLSFSICGIARSSRDRHLPDVHAKAMLLWTVDILSALFMSVLVATSSWKCLCERSEKCTL